MLRTGKLVREGRDAVVDHWLGKKDALRNPYSPHSKSRIFWQLGADKAAAVIDQLERIGA